MSNDEKKDSEAPQVYSFDDDVWHRVVQIVQEAMLTGVDCADLLRQIRVQNSPKGLTLTSQYRQMIKEHHKKLVAEAEAHAAARNPVGQG